jgi:hypothetical protein
MASALFEPSGDAGSPADPPSARAIRVKIICDNQMVASGAGVWFEPWLPDDLGEVRSGYNEQAWQKDFRTKAVDWLGQERAITSAATSALPPALTFIRCAVSVAKGQNATSFAPGGAGAFVVHSPVSSDPFLRRARRRTRTTPRFQSVAGAAGVPAQRAPAGTFDITPARPPRIAPAPIVR